MTSAKYFDAFSLVVTRGHSWSLVVTRGHSWYTRGILVVTRGHSLSLVVTRGHSCVLLDTILKNLRYSESIIEGQCSTVELFEKRLFKRISQFRDKARLSRI